MQTGEPRAGGCRHSIAPTRSSVLLAPLLLLLLAATAEASTFTSYGPQPFFRDSGAPVTFADVFSVKNPSTDYSLRVERDNQVTATVRLNGTTIFDHADFGRQVLILEESVNLRDINQLEVELVGLPAGVVTVTVFGNDIDPPTIVASVAPAPDSGKWHQRPPTVAFACGDATSGIAECPAAIRVVEDVEDRTITGLATDRAGNTATASATVSVDLTPPVVSISSPGDDDDVTSPVLTVTGTISDNLSGIAFVSCDGIPITATGSSFSCVKDLLPGGNSLRVEAMDVAGNVGSHEIGVVFQPFELLKQLEDTQPPVVVIDQPVGGATIAEPTVTVSGRVLDVLRGFSSPRNPAVEVTVTAPPRLDVTAGTRAQCRSAGGAPIQVDKKPAVVSNGTFMASGVALRPGCNTITASATDAAGNPPGLHSATVFLEAPAGNCIQRVGGDNQTALVGEALGNDLEVALTDCAGNALDGTVVFRVTRGDGTLGAGGARRLAVPTTSGRAAAALALGTRSGAGNHQVTATAPGFASSVVFTASALAGPAVGLRAASRTDRSGQPGVPLPEPFVVLAHDENGNPVRGLNVDFEVQKGDGGFPTNTQATRKTGDDGRAAVYFTLGSDDEANSNVVTASFANAMGLPVTFISSPRSDGSSTTVSGIVLDRSYEPLPDVEVSVGQNCSTSSSPTTTGDDGQFSVSATGGSLQTIVLEKQRYTRLCLDLAVYVGRDNDLGPLFLASRDAVQDADSGLTLTLDDLPGAELMVGPGSCGPDCDLAFTRLPTDQLPAPPPGGAPPAVAWSIEPPGIQFDPPARITLPNAAGLPPGLTTDIFSFDHEVGEFVVAGTATVSADGSSIVSDPGMGIRRSGTGYVASSLTPTNWVFSCDDGNQCTCDNPDPKLFLSQVNDCTSSADPEFDEPISRGLCEHVPLRAQCEDGLFCTTADGQPPSGDGKFRKDSCGGGGCRGQGVGLQSAPNWPGEITVDFDSADLDNFRKLLKKTEEAADPGKQGPCEFVGPSVVAGLTAGLKHGCCESTDQYPVALYTFKPTYGGQITFECGIKTPKPIKGVLEIGGYLGLQARADFTTEIEANLCRDFACNYPLIVKLTLKPFAELRIEIFGGIAGASAQVSYPASAAFVAQCSCPPELRDTLEGEGIAGDLEAALVLVNPALLGLHFAAGGTCGEPALEFCAGPATFQGQIKIAFIKIGYSYELPGSKFCDTIEL